MAIAEELIVALKSEGAEQTRAAVDKVGETVDQTKESVGGAADEFQGFQAEISGAMSAVIAGLAIAAAGLASQIPVLGGVAEGLLSIISAVVFQIDKKLRPVLQPVIDFLFDLANEIYQADGAMATLIATLGALVPAILGLKALGPVLAKIAGQFGLNAKTAKALLQTFRAYAPVLKNLGSLFIGLVPASVISAFGRITAAIIGAAGSIGALTAGILALSAALVGFGIAYNTNFLGIRDKTNALLADMVDAWRNFTDNLQKELNALVDSAIAWGRGIINNLIKGIRQGISDLIDTLNNIQSTIEAKIGVDVGSTSGGVGPRQMNMDRSSGSVSLDGRQLDENLGRYGRDRTSRRGI